MGIKVFFVIATPSQRKQLIKFFYKILNIYFFLRIFFVGFCLTEYLKHVHDTIHDGLVGVDLINLVHER